MHTQLKHNMDLSGSILRGMCAVASIFVLHAFAKTSPCEESPAPETKTKTKAISKDARKIFGAIWVEREKILQAECEITEYIINDKNEKQQFQKSWFILDAEIPALKSKSINLDDPSKTFVWIETLDNAVIYHPASFSMQIRPPEDARFKFRPHEFVDPRNLGFSTRVEIRRRAYHDLKAAYESLLKKDFTFAVRKDTDNGNREILEILSVKFKFQRRIVANPKRNYITEFAEMYYLHKLSPSTGPAWSMTTHWDLIAGINVPTECKIIKHSDNVTHIFKIDWKSINKPISKSEFSWQELEIDDDTRVLDASQGHDNSVIVRPFGIMKNKIGDKK